MELRNGIFNIKYLRKMKNDLEPIALNRYPKLNELKKFFRKIIKY